MRLFAIMMMVAGLAAIITDTEIDLGYIMDHSEPISIADRIWFVVIGVLCLPVSIFLMRRRPFRPDLGDVSMWLGKAGGYDPKTARGTELRYWWTGDRKPTSMSHERRSSARTRDDLRDSKSKPPKERRS